MHKKHPKRNPLPLSTKHLGLSTKHSPPSTTSWSNVADWYDSLVGNDGSEYHQHLILPGILRLLKIENGGGQKSKIENPSPLDILDLACGQGVLCRHLAQLGHHLTGIDAAPPLIQAAQQRNASDRLPIHYHIADATKLLGGGPSPPQHSRIKTQNFSITPNAFDAVTCILAIQNMTPLSPIWQAIHLALKPNAPLILVMMHPCFRIPKQSDWLWNDKLAAQGRVIYNYLSSNCIDIQTHPGLAAHGKSSSTTPHFHRPLQAYINTLGNAGLLIDHIEEWPSHKSSQPGPRKTALDHSRKEIPLFLALRARKL